MYTFAADRVIDIYAGANSSVSGVEYSISMHNNIVYISFGGSDGVADWRQNTKITPWYERGMGMCHRGFLFSARAAYEEINPLEFEGSVIVVGHSKGGAEATLFAAMMARDGKPPLRLITFGAPKCGMSALARALKDVPTDRFVNGDDIVPALPPKILFFELYSHHCPLTQLNGLWKPNIEDEGRIKDHSMSAYKDGLVIWELSNG